MTNNNYCVWKSISSEPQFSKKKNNFFYAVHIFYIIFARNLYNLWYFKVLYYSDKLIILHVLNSY